MTRVNKNLYGRKSSFNSEIECRSREQNSCLHKNILRVNLHRVFFLKLLLMLFHNSVVSLMKNKFLVTTFGSLINFIDLN